MRCQCGRVQKYRKGMNITNIVGEDGHTNSLRRERQLDLIILIHSPTVVLTSEGNAASAVLGSD